jgi:hypothetical protein
MPINAHPEYLNAEKEYMEAISIEDRIEKLKNMISHAPGHKGAENLRVQLKTRLKKLQAQLEKSKARKKGSGGKTGIKKEDLQAVIVGFSKSGKSSLLNILTKANTKVSNIPFTTTNPAIGIMYYYSVPIQIIEIPAIESEYYDKGVVYTSDTIILLINSIEEIPKLMNLLEKNPGKKIIAFNKIDTLTENEKRKLNANLQSKKYNFTLISTETGEGIQELKEKLFKSFNKLRIYTKEPGKEMDKSKEKPVILNPNSTIQDVAEKILKGFSKKVIQTKIWGPSSKFPGQIVSLKHEVKDLDTVEFKTK